MAQDVQDFLSYDVDVEAAMDQAAANLRSSLEKGLVSFIDGLNSDVKDEIDAEVEDAATTYVSEEDEEGSPAIDPDDDETDYTSEETYTIAVEAFKAGADYAKGIFASKLQDARYTGRVTAPADDEDDIPF